MTEIIIYSIVFLCGVIIGYVAHIIATNKFLIKKGISPKEFFKSK
jgi:hypothetical protein